jgi:hypothetical protein
MIFSASMRLQRGALVAGLAQLALQIHPRLLLLQPCMTRDSVVGHQLLVISGTRAGQLQGRCIARDLVIDPGQPRPEVLVLPLQLALGRLPLRTACAANLRQLRRLQLLHRLHHGRRARHLQPRLSHGIGGLVAFGITAGGIQFHEDLADPHALSFPDQDVAHAGHLDGRDGLDPGRGNDLAGSVDHDVDVAHQRPQQREQDHRHEQARSPAQAGRIGRFLQRQRGRQELGFLLVVEAALARIALAPRMPQYAPIALPQRQPGPGTMMQTHGVSPCNGLPACSAHRCA